MRLPVLPGLVLAVVVACSFVAAPALAHRVNVFAYVEGDTVHVECGYSRSDRVRFGEITVKNAATGTIYLTGKTDDKGNFSFPVPQAARKDKADLSIHLDAGEGHQNDCPVKADEYLRAAGAGTMGGATSQEGGSGQPVPTPPATPPALETTPVPSSQRVATSGTGPVTAGVDPVALRAVVEQAVETKIAPIRKMLLDEKEKGPGLAEIAGGIGWLVGIAGLLAYVRCRKGGRGA